VSQEISTKGLYGTYIRLKNSNKNQNSSILVMDFQGMFESINSKTKNEKAKTKFD
jgi:hypothetical protein